MKKTLIVALMLAGMGVGAWAQEVKRLPEPDKNVSMPLMEALQKRHSSRDYCDKAISDSTLSQVLWAACGVNRPEEKKITAPSAINAQDIKLYVCTAQGAWLYDAFENTLTKVTDENVLPALARGQDFVQKAPLTLLMVSDGQRFGDNAEVLGAMDAGYVSQNICLVCEALGLKTVPRATHDKEALKKALKLGDRMIPMLNNPISY